MGMSNEFIIPKPLSADWVIQKLREELISLGIARMINVHGLRHTHVSWLLSQGI